MTIICIYQLYLVQSKQEHYRYYEIHSGGEVGKTGKEQVIVPNNQLLKYEFKIRG